VGTPYLRGAAELMTRSMFEGCLGHQDLVQMQSQPSAVESGQIFFLVTDSVVLYRISRLIRTSYLHTHDLRVSQQKPYFCGGRFRERHGRMAADCYEDKAWTPCQVWRDAASLDQSRSTPWLSRF
jgi:hypothetical protein